MKFRGHKEKKITTRVTITARECGDNPDKMMRKFIKTVKKEGIMDELRERRYYKKPSEVRSERKRQKDRLIKKNNQQRVSLSQPREYLKKKRRRN